jgi:hypothetical protein
MKQSSKDFLNRIQSEVGNKNITTSSAVPDETIPYFDRPDEPSEADKFFEALKNDPQKIIRWAKSEIREYKRLIKLLEGK